MKILSVHISTPGEGADWWRISNIAKILKNNGHEVHFINYCSKSAFSKLENRERYKDQSFVISSPLTVHLNHLRKLQQDKYDLVYGNAHIGTFCSILGKITNAPLFFDMHGGIVEEFLMENRFKFDLGFISKYLWKKTIDLADLKFSDRIACVSHKMEDYLKIRSVSHKKIGYVTNGVDLDFFKPLEPNRTKIVREKLGLEKRLVFGYVGNFHKWQGVENFIQAANEIKGDDCSFVIIGGDKRTKEGNLHFIPKVSRQYLPDYYSMCDILVLPRPSHVATEIAAPTKFAEYTSMTRPILTTKVGDAAQLVEQYNCGISVKDNSPEELIKGINFFKEKSIEHLAKMGDNSRKLAEKEFSWKNVGINLQEMLSDFE
ncbi:MAG: glycosyltransferase family 4 protein [Candidatus Altiarchaeia archaeon]